MERLFLKSYKHLFQMPDRNYQKKAKLNEHYMFLVQCTCVATNTIQTESGRLYDL